MVIGVYLYLCGNAVASGHLITTVNDMVAVVVYYGLSWLILLNKLYLA